MRRKTNLIRLTKKGKERIKILLNSFSVNQYHKTLLKGISDRTTKNNLSRADCDIYETINNQYLEVEKWK